MALVGGFHVVVWTIPTRRHVVASLYLKGFSLTTVLLDHLLLKFGVGYLILYVDLNVYYI